MQYLFLLIVVVMSTAQSLSNKQYSLKAEKANSFIFAATVAFTAMIFFILSSGFKLDFNAELIPYSIGFAIAYACGLVGQFLAIKWGPLSITLLVISYSLLIPTMYGIIALGDKLSLIGVIGLVLLAISLLLISNVFKDKRSKPESTDKKQFSLKWLIALAVGFVGNGMCSTIQKMQQTAFEQTHKSEFMVIALAIAVIVLIIAAIANKEDIRVSTLPCIGFAVITGVANGIVNLLVMVLTGMMNNSILFPSISAGGIVLGFILAIFLYKEKLSPLQIVGYVIGTASVVLLNI